jgi:hypothetical protein
VIPLGEVNRADVPELFTNPDIGVGGPAPAKVVTTGESTLKFATLRMAWFPVSATWRLFPMTATPSGPLNVAGAVLA